MMLSADRITVRYPDAGQPTLSDISLAVDRGEVVGLLGPNGSGKTTLLRTLLGILQPAAGTLGFEGKAPSQWSPRDLARRVGVVTQSEERVFAFRVHEVVMLGRYPHLGPLGRPGATDRDAVADAMTRCDIGQLADRRADTLSGGEWQRVRLARALAQRPQLLVLDEPTAGLDMRHGMEILDVLRRLAVEGIGSLFATHDLNLAARHADRLLLLHRGKLAAQGSPAVVLRPDILEQVFDWPVAVTPWIDGTPHVVPLKPGEASASRT